MKPRTSPPGRRRRPARGRPTRGSRDRRVGEFGNGTASSRQSTSHCVEQQHELAEDVERRVAGVEEQRQPGPARRAARRRSGDALARAASAAPAAASPWARSRSISLAGSPLAHRRRRPAPAPAGQSSATSPLIARAAAFSLMLSIAAGGPSPPISARKWPTVSSRSSTGSRSSNDPAPRPSSSGVERELLVAPAVVDVAVLDAEQLVDAELVRADPVALAGVLVGELAERRAAPSGRRRR